MNPSIVFVASHPMSIKAFMLPHIKALSSFVPVQVLANSHESNALMQQNVNVAIDFVPIVRPISLWRDLQSLWILYWRFKRDSPLAVHTITPKAGLLGLMAAWMARVPVRVHCFTGQVWVTRKGLLRRLLKEADRLIASMATDVLVDSSSQRDFLIEQGIVTCERSSVMGYGSICGVNTERFCPNKLNRKIVRRELRSSSDSTVCLYLGRLNRDKGVLVLANAFAQVAGKYPKVELWVVGPDEGDYFLQMEKLFGNSINQVRRVEFTANPERFMQAADLFCLPSYREGFGSSVIETGACGVPALVSRIYGLTDAVVEGQTGWMHMAGDVQDLSKQLDYLLTNPAELAVKGKAARQYVETFFAEEIVTDAMLKFYQERLL